MSELTETQPTMKQLHQAKTRMRRDAKVELEAEIHHIRQKYEPEIQRLKTLLAREVDAAHFEYREKIRQANELTK